ncbi:serine protease : Serine protease OS=Azospirillum brasilense GN=ABAZ39_04295 PE=4 SV=1: PDZ_2 [Gemmataceae bacterium]|nr:serine protease : Serine protease OS=Azospirillum brasilense GN=ABAZ39_04295 PE=4 SV=1: PDZ_2 [Gemmataceae bacterium]VTT98190.1 serine protease : Serine protease OS=Azospirillum brasilense GN=ABAZ39_04295 PE=4 SV=1: PDZ_2 [Gemmataceae bacterium]
MDHIKSRSLAALAVLGLAASLVGFGTRMAAAQDKGPDLTDLRDAVKAANKRGANVTEVAQALDALEKSLAKGWAAPDAGKTVPPPPELVALRDAVEVAAKKGEAVEAIQKELEAVEKAMTGRVLDRPKPAPVVDPPIRPNPNPFVRPDFQQPFVRPFPVPVRPGVNAEELQKAQDLMRKAIEMRLKDPDDAEALKLLAEARELMLKALANGGGGAMVFPDLDFANPAIRLPERARLGLRLERITPLVAEQLGLAAGTGVGISEVLEGSIAEKVGFKSSDVVVEFAGKPVTDAPEDFTRQVNAVRGGEKVDAVVVRKGKKVELKGIEFPAARPLPRRDRDLVPRGDDLPRRPIPGALDKAKSTTSVTVANGKYTIVATRDGMTYTVVGTKAESGLVLSEVTIEGNGMFHRTDELNKVPAEYLETVGQLLKSVKVNGVEVRD